MIKMFRLFTIQKKYTQEILKCFWLNLVEVCRDLTFVTDLRIKSLKTPKYSRMRWALSYRIYSYKDFAKDSCKKKIIIANL